MRISVCVAFLAVCMLISGCSDDHVSIERAVDCEAVGQNEDSAQEVSVDDCDAPDSDVTVYICGAVNSPGVYSFKTGARIVDVIEAAGGVTGDADISCVNQAELLYDSQMIEILTEDERREAQESAVEAALADTRVDINHADETVLMTLPGIGQQKAKAIVDFRDSNGDFQEITDLKKIPGIKDGVYNKIKDMIRI